MHESVKDGHIVLKMSFKFSVKLIIRRISSFFGVVFISTILSSFKISYCNVINKSV